VKEYEMPVDIRDMWLKWKATESIVNKLIRIPFKLKKATKLKLKNLIFSIAIWEKTYEFYPELRSKNCGANYRDSIIFVKDNGVTLPQDGTGEVKPKNKSK